MRGGREDGVFTLSKGGHAAFPRILLYGLLQTALENASGVAQCAVAEDKCFSWEDISREPAIFIHHAASSKHSAEALVHIGSQSCSSHSCGDVPHDIPASNANALANDALRPRSGQKILTKFQHKIQPPKFRSKTPIHLNRKNRKCNWWTGAGIWWWEGEGDSVSVLLEKKRRIEWKKKRIIYIWVRK
ncbi:hypothetical protein BSKO_07577 [Bryopsis sp. KO-2023]|nr:hypothetical protein BSKO_07577 [Bryopsis sp. KO-2023]